MNLKTIYRNDIEFILSKKHVNGGDLWTGDENNIGKGSPFSTRDASLILVELGFSKRDKIIKDIASLIFEHQQPDGRFRISKSGTIYPCHTIGCLRTLCYLGYAKDKRLKKTFDHLIAIQRKDGGWKCNKFSFGKGPETDHSNPGPTLEALDAFRFADADNTRQQTENAVKFLLWHWKIKKPVGPCLYGIGTLFHKTEYPFFRYNLFYYTYVLSFYEKAVTSTGFKAAYRLLKGKLKEGQMIVENPNRQLAHMDLCLKAQPSTLATKRFKEIEINIHRSAAHNRDSLTRR